MSRQSVLTGADQLQAEGCARLRGQRIGLLTNPTGVTRDLISTVDLLAGAEGVTLAALFGPEHGLAASAEAGEEVGEVLHPRLGIPVHSLYGDRLAPAPASLADLDLLVIDLQDVGARFFTYNATVALALEVCGRVGTPVLVLDRPNPIGGTIIEGPIVAPAQRSFVGHLPIPIRHGLTLGELALLANATEGYGATLEVLPVLGWRRDAWFDRTGLPWVLPSPNLPTLDTAIVYPGTCLCEGTPLSEGRGTTRPFEFLGAPWLDADRLAADMNARDLPGVRWRPVAFTPQHGRIHVGVPCCGVQPHPTDRAAFRPVTAALHLIAEARRQAPERFTWREPWAAGSQLPIDLLSGTTGVREAIDAGVPPGAIVASWDDELARFGELRRAYLLYD